jgi:serine protease
MARRLSIVLLILIGSLTACTGGGGNGTPGPGPAPTIAIVPSTTQLTVGQEADLVATANSVATNQVTWSSAAPGIVSVSSSGRVRGESVGSTTITATSTTHPTAKGTATITVMADPDPDPDPGPAPTLAIIVSDANLVVGDTATVTATANGLPTTAVTWSSSAPTRVSVSVSGTLGAHNAGFATITATSTTHPSATASAVVAVTANPDSETTSGVAGIVSGNITVFGGNAAAVPLLADVSVAHNASATPAADFVAGDIIVAYRDGMAPQSTNLQTQSGRRLQVVRETALTGTLLLRYPEADASSTLAAISELQADPNVLYAQPNYWLRPLAVPNDPAYSYQWHYPAINLPQAWDITTGSSSVVVAVVDTGILYSQTNPSLRHPDFGPRVLPGYDFISNPNVARDGDARDGDPFDVGDNPLGQSSYHGSHVAGTIGATTNNGIGVAGVDWSARILPIRVLGFGGGSMLDVMEGTLWAAGFPISGVPNNPNPAHVINLSLGRDDPNGCSPYEQAGFTQIFANTPQRAIVVVAAGNSDIDAWGASPAACANVITVGATEWRDYRAPYSNYGTRIDVMAPGGDTNVDRNGDTEPDGVLSIVRSDATGVSTYAWYQGTSMAAPHVAGVLALMKGLEPTLSFNDALAVLKGTADPLTATECQRPSGADCGAGLIDARAAVEAVDTSNIPAPSVGQLTFTPAELNFGSLTTSLQVQVANTGSTPLSWTLTYDPTPGNPGPMPFGTVGATPLSGTVAGNGTQMVTVTIDRNAVAQAGTYSFDLVFSLGTDDARLPVTFTKAVSVSTTPQGPMIVAAFLDNPPDYPESGYLYKPTALSQYSFAALAGNNLIIAWSDENDNGEVDDGDFLSFDVLEVPISNYAVTTGANVEVERVFGTQADVATQIAGPGWRETLERLMRAERGR